MVHLILCKVYSQIVSKIRCTKSLLLLNLFARALCEINSDRHHVSTYRLRLMMYLFFKIW